MVIYSIVASVCGTHGDPQVYESQVDQLRENGVVVLETNAQAARYAFKMIDKNYRKDRNDMRSPISKLFKQPLKVINLGLDRFADDLEGLNIQVTRVNWSVPVPGGNKKMLSLLSKLR
ncbi:MAG: hypothetical protein ACOX47_01190 [Bacillota bacterium]